MADTAAFGACRRPDVEGCPSPTVRLCNSTATHQTNDPHERRTIRTQTRAQAVGNLAHGKLREPPPVQTNRQQGRTPRTNEGTASPRGQNGRKEPRAAFPRRANEATATPAQNERARCHGGKSRAAGVPITPKPPSHANNHPSTAKNGRTDSTSETAKRARRGNGPTEPSEPDKPNKQPAETSEGRGRGRPNATPAGTRQSDPRQTDRRRRTITAEQGNRRDHAPLCRTDGGCGSLNAVISITRMHILHKCVNANMAVPLKGDVNPRNPRRSLSKSDLSGAALL